MPPLPKLSLYIGIDPGQRGGVAVLRQDGTVADVYKMPETERDIWDRLGLHHVIHPELYASVFAMIEQVHSMPRQGVASSFKFGQGYGGLRMALTAAKIPFEAVTPQKWQKEMGIVPRKKGETDRQWKNRLKAAAQRLFPDIEVTLKTADALLIADYCRRIRHANQS